MKNKFYFLFFLILVLILSGSEGLFCWKRLYNPIFAGSLLSYFAHYTYDSVNQSKPDLVFAGPDSLQKYFYLPLKELITQSRYSIKHFFQKIIKRKTIFGCPYFGIYYPQIISYFPISDDRFVYDYSILYYLWEPWLLCSPLKIQTFVESFFATSGGEIITIDSLSDTYRTSKLDNTIVPSNYHRINPVIWENPTDPNLFYYLSYDKIYGSNFKFILKTFKINPNDIQLVETKTIEDGFDDTLKNPEVINFSIVPHQNGKDFWIVLYTVHSDYTPKNFLVEAYGNIRTYLLKNDNGEFTLVNQPVYSKSFLFDSTLLLFNPTQKDYYPISIGFKHYPLVFSPDYKLIAIYPGFIYLYPFEMNKSSFKSYIFIFKFDNLTGEFYPLNTDLALEQSKIYTISPKQFKYPTEFEESHTRPTDNWCPWYEDWIFNYNLGHFMFSFDSKKLFFGRYCYDLTLSNFDTISHKFTKWLPDSLTPLEFLVSLGVNLDNVYSLDFTSPEFIGVNGKIYDYLYFPIPNGRFLLMTLNDLDTLSTGLCYPTEYFLLKVYEVENPNHPEKIKINFLFSDTLFSELCLRLKRVPEEKDLPFNRVFLTYPPVYLNYLYGDVSTPLRAFSNTPVCENEDIILRSFLIYDTLKSPFRWTGPNGFEAIGDSVVIGKAQMLHSGWYYCYADVGDTTYVDSVEVEVVPTPRISFKRGIPIRVCNADSVELEIEYPRASCCDYSVLWSTGDTTSKAIIRSEGNYWVKVWNEIGCMDSVGFEVKFNKGLDVRINAERDWICSKGDSLELIAESEGNKYKWSDGVEGRRRMVYSAGVYTVVVTNNYGCIDSASMVVQEENVEIKVDGKVDFDTLYIGKYSEKEIVIENVGRNNVKIGKINLVGDAYEAEVMNIENRILHIGEKRNIKVKFTAKELGENRGAIIIPIDSPCVVDYQVELFGIGRGKVVVWSPWDTLAEVGWTNYCIPAYAKVVEGKQEDEYVWSGSMLISSKLLSGSDGVIKGNVRYKTGSGIELLRKNEDKIILTLCGNVMMSGQEYEPVELDSFDFGKYVEVETRDGRVHTVGVCMPELSQVERFVQLTITAKADESGDKMAIEIVGEKGREYRLRIYNIMGSVIEELHWEKLYQQETIWLDMRTIGNGLFLIEATNGLQIARCKVIKY